MRFESTADICSEHEKAREALIKTVTGISDQEATALPDGEKWSIQHIVEHISIVNSGIARLCGKLIDDAKASGSDEHGSATISSEFYEKAANADGEKFEAPERVRPTGNVTIADALEKINANRPLYEAMRVDLEKYDVSGPKFPHPYFGELNAVEWLTVAGGHERRHTAQIRKLLAKIRA